MVLLTPGIDASSRAFTGVTCECGVGGGRASKGSRALAESRGHRVHQREPRIVCREKAESFSRADGRALLEISNIHHIDAIVPCNARVPNSPSPSIPEQEILLNRGNTFTVLENLEDDAGRRVLRIEAIAATS